MSGRLLTPLLALLFLLSGASSLIYETAWTRLFQDVFGHSVHTNAAVLAAFMAGLALGAVVASRVVAQVRRPILLYGVLELVAVLLVWTSPAQVALVDRLLPAVAGELWIGPLSGGVLRWAAAFLMVVLPTSVMGATLPLLCQALTSDRRLIGKVFGGLYGANTLGAVVGVFAAGYWLILRFGVVGTIRVGCGLGLVAAIGALATSFFTGEHKRVAKPATRTPQGNDGNGDVIIPGWLLAVVLCSGFASMAYEIAWFRTFVFILDSNILSFSMVLGTLLLALGIGSVSFPWVVRDRARHLEAFGWIELGLGCTAGMTVLLFLRFDLVVGWVQSVGLWPDAFASLAGRSALTVAVLLFPGLCMGAALPAVTGVLRDHRRSGRGVGVLYATNTTGNIVGSLVAGYLLVPVLGTSRTLVGLAILNIGLGVIVLAKRGRLVRWPALAAVTGCLVLLGWIGFTATGETARKVAARRNPHATLTSIREALRGTVTVSDVAPLPILAANTDPPPVAPIAWGYRMISVDGVDVAGTSPDLRTTQKMQAHIPLLLHGPADRVLQIGYGSGETTREALLHEPGAYDLVEINPDVVREANQWFPQFVTQGFNTVFADAKNYVRTTNRHYDVILNDSTYPGISGSSLLYSKDHFEACRDRLAPGGVVSTWLPIDLPVESLRMILATFSSVFPQASLWLPTNCWNKHGVLVGSLDQQEVLVARLRTTQWPPAVRGSLSELGYDDTDLFVSIQVLDADDIRSLAEGSLLNSDDHPYLEYPTRGVQVAAESFWHETLRLILQRMGPPGRSLDPIRDAVRLVLSGQLAFLQGETEQALRFYERAHGVAPDHPGPATLRQDIFTFRAQEFLEQAMAAFKAGDSNAALSSLQRSVEFCPSSALARYELARLLFDTGQVPAAIPHLEACIVLSDRFPRSLLMLGDARLLSGEYAAAETRYREFLADNEPQFEVLVALADAISNQGRAGEARVLLEQAQAMQPENQIVERMLANLEGR